MKRIVAKIILTGLILSSISSAHAEVSWGQWFKNGLSSIKTSISNSSTETKILVGLGALATAGISYLIYRYCNPTDEELCQAADVKIRDAQGHVALMPTIEPLDENLLNTIGWKLINHKQNPEQLSASMRQSIRALKTQHDILNRRVNKYAAAKQYGSILLDDNLKAIAELIPQLEVRRTILNTHAHYFRAYPKTPTSIPTSLKL